LAQRLEYCFTDTSIAEMKRKHREALRRREGMEKEVHDAREELQARWRCARQRDDLLLPAKAETCTRAGALCTQLAKDYREQAKANLESEERERKLLLAANNDKKKVSNHQSNRELGIPSNELSQDGRNCLHAQLMLSSHAGYHTFC
jgi:hypothetical protein